MLCKFDVDSVRLFKCVQVVVGSSLISYGCEKISCVATCFTAMFGCFKWFMRLMLICGCSLVVLVASGRFKIFFVFGSFASF